MKKYGVNALRFSVALVGLIILLLCIFWLPQMARVSAEQNPEHAYLRYPLLYGLYITTIPFYLGIFHTFKLLNLISKNTAFTVDACKSLGRIQIYTIIEIALYFIGMVFLNLNNVLHPGIFILGLVIIFACFIISVFSSVLKALLTKVVEIKNENDYTI
jgi:predicted MFS family arabinose efflux permease